MNLHFNLKKVCLYNKIEFEDKKCAVIWEVYHPFAEVMALFDAITAPQTSFLLKSLRFIQICILNSKKCIGLGV